MQIKKKQQQKKRDAITTKVNKRNKKSKCEHNKILAQFTKIKRRKKE